MNEGREESFRGILREVLKAVREIRYGSVEILIHDSRIVQVERREKLRPIPERGKRA